MSGYDGTTPTGILLRSVPSVATAVVETAVDVLVGSWILLSLLNSFGGGSLLAVPVVDGPLTTALGPLFNGFIVLSAVGWTLYVASMRAGAARESGREAAGWYQDPFEEADSIADIEYWAVLRAVFLNGLSAIYKAAAVFLGAALATQVADLSTLLALPVAFGYPVLDSRLARWFLPSSPAMLVVLVTSVFMYFTAHLTAAVIRATAGVVGVAVEFPERAPSLADLLAVLQPDRSSVMNLLNQLGRRALVSG